ncbi:MAG: 4-hydroxy-3-methylbut-2-enyl diphosphate reductase [Bacteroidales bacterium]|nr:4-hydroxy-3-methylbut-2-enyl diphosphate reductase [Bacteroidales bacterium]
MKIEIDPKAGFCFGVTRVVSKAEEIMQQHGQLYCLGEIVHNQKEIERLEEIGLKTITNDEYLKLSNCRVLIRAHGEPPETYEYARKNNIELIDGTCPIVLRLQSKIKKDFGTNSDSGAQIVIFGKKDHAEVRGLAGQTNYQTLIVESPDDINKIDFSRPVHLYAQTTMSTDKYHDLQQAILQKAKADEKGMHSFMCNNTICGQVSGRIPQLKKFCTLHDLILFVSYKQSSNGKLLFEQCKTVNANSHFINEKEDIQPGWFSGIQSVGITGATSTPRWLLEEIEAHVNDMGV